MTPAAWQLLKSGMNPDDDGATMTEDEIASEEYVGAMQAVCDALDQYTEIVPIEDWDYLRDRLAAWRAIRDRNATRHIAEVKV